MSDGIIKNVKAKVAVAGIVAAVLLALPVAWINRGQQPDPQAEVSDYSEHQVNFTAPDGYPLSATFWQPQADRMVPAVILVHQFEADRHDFDKFIPLLLVEGYAVLAYDIRSHGLSWNGTAAVEDFPLDVIGAVEFLQQQPEVDPNRIGIVGASVGANIAFVSLGSLPEIKAVVALSPSDKGLRSALLGQGVSGFDPRNIFIASDEKEKAEADAIYALAQDPRIRNVYLGHGHGVSLLNSSEAVSDIVAFLDSQLK